MRNVSKVDNPIVGRFAVDVVNLSGWPGAVHKQVGKPVKFIPNSVNLYSPVLAKRYWQRAANGYLLMSHLLHDEDARFWVVLKNLCKSLRGKITISHEAPVLLIGQKLVAISGRLPASIFSHRN